MSSPPLPRRPPRTRRRKHLIAEHLLRLAESARGLARDEKLVREMVETCLKLLRNGTPVGDIKILNAALRELRYAFKVFAPYRNVRKVSVFGSARSARESSACRTAFEFAQRIRDAGYMVITGAGHGIMGACQEGAGPDHSFGVNIRLPFEQGPNEVIAKDPKLLTFRYFFTRKLIFIKEADAAALFPGGFGTHDEAYQCLTLVQTGKTKPMPIVFLDAPRGTYWKTWKRYVGEHLLRHRLISPEDMALFKVTSSVDEAVEEITRFYRVYHSARTVDRNLVIRLTHRIPESLVTQLGHDFADIVVKGEIVQTGALEEEREDAPELVRLPRLVLEFNRSSFGRLRQLIDRLNSDG
ncbi:MAG: LOG family protein [Deltaproteobacteria bacterium]|nr:MAG: LOG family protein [Deltaproteobacteria bacterium]